MKRFSMAKALILLLALVFLAPLNTEAKSRIIKSEKQYWQALYDFSKGGSSSLYLDLSEMNIKNFNAFESPSNWKYGADKGYVITQDFDYNIVRTLDGEYDYSTLWTIGRPTYIIRGVKLTWDTPAQRAHAKAVHKKANAIIKKIIKPKMSKAKRVNVIRRYITKHVSYKYNTDTKYLFNSYGALVKGIAACQGNSAAFNLLARKAGIPSIMATNKKENHAWNLYKIGKSYYMIDCTMTNKMGIGTKVSKLKYKIYKKYNQRKYYKTLFPYVKMIKW